MIEAAESSISRCRMASLTPAAGEEVPAKKGDLKSWLYSEAGLWNLVVFAKERDLAKVPGVAVWYGVGGTGADTALPTPEADSSISRTACSPSPSWFVDRSCAIEASTSSSSSLLICGKLADHGLRSLETVCKRAEAEVAGMAGVEVPLGASSRLRTTKGDWILSSRCAIEGRGPARSMSRAPLSRCRVMEL